MGRTVLDMVQEMLSRSDGAAVNSITDSEEAMQMASALKSTYEEIVVPGSLTEQTKLVELTASSDNQTPTLMYLPENIVSIQWLKYNVAGNGEAPDYYDITRWDIDTFLNSTYKLDKTQDAFFRYTITIDGATVDIFGYSDSQPAHYTILADKYVLFDSYDKAKDASLQKNKTLALASVLPVFSVTDGFIPELRDEQFPLLVNEALKQVSIENRQAENPIANQRARRGWIRKARVNDDLRLRNYGRK